MFDNLRPWINVPISIKPFVKRTGTGDKEFGEMYPDKCYPESQIVVVKDSTGSDVTSNTHLYMDGTSSVKALDVILFEGREWPVHTVSTFYRNGVADIKVVYI